MELKSSIIKEYLIKEYCNNNSVKISDLSDNFELVIDGINISKRYYKEEVSKIKEDLFILLEKRIRSITLKNIDIEESEEMNFLMQQIAYKTKKIRIENSNVGNLDSYISEISGKVGKNYFLSEQQYIKEFEYNKDNQMLVLAAENLDILSEINRYKKAKILKIKVYTKNALKNIVKYIEVIREMNLSKNILVDKSEGEIVDLYKYENYINEKVILFQSDVIKESLGLDRLPTKKINQTMYNIKIDGTKVGENCIYVLEGEQEEFFIKDIKEISKYINIANIEYHNIIFNDNYAIKYALNEVQGKVQHKEVIRENYIEVNRSVFDIIKEKIFKLFNINCGINKNQKAFPVYNEKM